MSELNARQWALYNFLRERGDAWTFQEDIAYALPQWYCPTGNEDFHNTRERKIMTRDIQKINNSTIIQKIIISSPKYGVKLATESEWRENIKREYINVFNKLKRIRHKEKKGCLDGQMRLVFKSERAVIEAFLNED